MPLALARYAVRAAVDNVDVDDAGVLVQALERAIRAEESAKSAHHRLDRINGSLDRLAGAVEAHRRDSSEQLSAISTRLAGDEGVMEGRRQIITPARAAIVAALAALVSIAGDRLP